MQHPPAWTIQRVEQSGVRGRGGAGFPTGQKWRLAANATGARKYVIANGDEGDPGSYIDRLLMEFDPHAILEGLLLGGFAIGAQVGVVYIRSEYPAAHGAMLRAVKEARDAGFLGPSVCGLRFSFDVHVFPGMGSYVCGEETALLNAIEGQRGEVRVRPPYPVSEGLFGCPTVVDNVETLVNVPWIVVNGPTAYQALGTTASPGTKALCFNHGFAHPGVVEVGFGTPLRAVIDEARGDREIEAILLGGPMGSIVPAADWDVPICITEMARRGITLGHGGMVALARKTDYRALLTHLLEFMKDESCGRCVPCRIGSRRAWELAQAGVSPKNCDTLLRLLEVMGEASLCAFGRESPQPVRQILQLFPDRIFGTEGGRP
ncbi:MAG: hypothetical protein HZB38_19515 [Planctomycetes bacterium]|nr:hypothetical protein [Planctomycetota bacterium]